MHAAATIPPQGSSLATGRQKPKLPDCPHEFLGPILGDVACAGLSRRFPVGDLRPGVA